MNESKLRAKIVLELKSEKGRLAPDKFARYMSDKTNQPVKFVKEVCEEVAVKGAYYELKDYLL
eukprot:gnl/Chilomastix_caulleri/6173.p2 GENE.gnl/Chilomastix_caulleri/6173~~gnl/Chilomastix_caulleri/6173.p2  ORF type:complete len:63 (+),score=15.00 gnl/Chilomastix_caulleri/6173:288-476(+)